MAAVNTPRPAPASITDTIRSTSVDGTRSPKPTVLSDSPLTYSASAKPRPPNGAEAGKSPTNGR